MSPTPAEMVIDYADGAMAPQHAPRSRVITAEDTEILENCHEYRRWLMYIRPCRSVGATGYTMMQKIKDWKSRDHMSASILAVSRPNLVEIGCIHQAFCLECSCRSCVILLFYATPHAGVKKVHVYVLQQTHTRTATSVDLDHRHFRQLWQP